jgi:hypothetical protein
MLLEDVAALMARAKCLDEKLTTALDLRYSERARRARAAEGKDTGRVRLVDEDFEVIADLPKATVWDQRKLATVFSVIAEQWRENPHEYITVKYGVPESKFSAWPTPVRKLFEPARTVKPGKPSYSLAKKEAA